MGFENYRAYDDFALKIKNENRFAQSEEAQKFLSVFREQLKNRVVKLVKETVLHRAVRDYVEEIDVESHHLLITGSDEARILPDKTKVTEGRANPSGIAYLYVASSQKTAVSEIRPWVGEAVTLAVFKTCQDLRLVDLSRGHGKTSLQTLSFGEILGQEPISQEKADNCVWNSIDNAFSQPTTKSDTGAEYVPTQILAEIIREMGFDGIGYKSLFGGDRGYNLVLFDLKSVNILTANAFEIKSIDVSFDAIGNQWVRKQ